MPELMNPMKKQTVYAEGKIAFADGKHRGFNPYRWSNKELATIWADGWNQAKRDKEVKDRKLT